MNRRSLFFDHFLATLNHPLTAFFIFIDFVILFFIFWTQGGCGSGAGPEDVPPKETTEVPSGNCPENGLPGQRPLSCCTGAIPHLVPDPLKLLDPICNWGDGDVSAEPVFTTVLCTSGFISKNVDTALDGAGNLAGGLFGGEFAITTSTAPSPGPSSRPGANGTSDLILSKTQFAGAKDGGDSGTVPGSGGPSKSSEDQDDSLFGFFGRSRRGSGGGSGSGFKGGGSLDPSPSSSNQPASAGNTQNSENDSFVYKTGGRPFHGGGHGRDQSELSGGSGWAANVLEMGTKAVSGPTGDENSDLAGQGIGKRSLDLFKQVESRYIIILGRWHSEGPIKAHPKPNVDRKVIEMLTTDPSISK